MKIYTIEEVAKLLKCSERQIFRYLKDKKLSGSKQGKWRFTDKDIKDFLKRGRLAEKSKHK
ncbi:MAG: helix-turn-helix domain-containing protein [Candidatus Paceibacterota bacterium]